MPNQSGTLTSARGPITFDVSPNDALQITVNSGTYSLENPPGTVVAAASSLSTTYTLATAQARLVVQSGSVTYSLTDGSDYPTLGTGDGIYLPERPAGFAANAWLANVRPYLVGGRWDCNIKPESLIDTSSWTRTYFVDSVNGNNVNTGLSWAQRVQSIGQALRLASASGIPSRILVDGSAALPYYRQISCGDDGLVRASAVPILLEAVNGRVHTGVFDNLTWTKTSGQTYVYQATRSNASRVVNAQERDAYGIPLEYRWVASVVLCDATEGSWFTDGTTTYVHPHNHTLPSIDNARVLLQGTRGLEWQSNQNLLVRGFDFFGGAQGALKVSGGSTNIVVVDDCTIRHASAGNTENGSTAYVDACPVNGVGLFAAFDSAAEKGSSDGFGLHAEAAVIPTGLFVRCRGRFNGRGGSASDNGYTTHDGVKSISIGGDWRFNTGIGSGHVNAGTQAWCVGDLAGGSYGDVPNGGTFEGGAFGGWNSVGGLWLDSCRDVGAAIGIYGDTSGPVYVRNHRGTGERRNTTVY